jgi:hypothetical protein
MKLVTKLVMQLGGHIFLTRAAEKSPPFREEMKGGLDFLLVL